MKNIILIALTLLILSCSKDRRVIVRIDGTWQVDSLRITYVHYKRFGTSTFFELDTTKTYLFTNCGQIIFNKKRTANGDYRNGNLLIKVPKLSGFTDTNKIDRPLNDKESFNFFVDQLPNIKHYSKLGIVGDTSKIYRISKFSDSELQAKKITLDYIIDSLDSKIPFDRPHNLKLRKAVVKAYISKQ